MENSQDLSENITLYNKVKKISAWGIFIFSLVLYTFTMAPTTSFWDCGEFIACSYTLGVPHPPGTPLFMLVGRCFTIIEFFPEIAVQINFISALCSALTVLMCFLIIARALEYWVKHDNIVLQMGVVIGASLAGSVTLTFSDTFWFNAVEAEVYATAMFIMLLCTWLAFKWYDQRKEKGSERLIYLIIYIMFLSSGIHILSMMVIPAILLMMVIMDADLRNHWAPYYIGFILSMVIFAVPYFIFLVLFCSTVLYIKIVFQKNIWPPYFSAIIGAFLVYVSYSLFSFVSEETTDNIRELINGTSIFFGIVFVVLTFIVKEQRRYASNFWFWIIFLSLIAYTPQTYIPIRSNLNPIIDENNPENWKNFQGFLERKQYGQESMLASMFKRRTSWLDQFGMNKNAGLYRFFRQQYVNPGNILGIPFLRWEFLPMIIGIIGLIVQWKRHFISGQYLAFLLFIGSVGLLLYINFKPNEVRVRDYFYTPCFVYFSIWIGIGVGAILNYLVGIVNKSLVLTAAGLFIIAPFIPIVVSAKHNDESDRFFVHDRHKDFIPWEYAYNLLNSCDKGGIIFTNGDNDTFPLWFLQEVKKIRNDVRIVNLSLLNTPWYIKQLKENEPKLKLRFSDDFIDTKLRPRRLPKAGVIKIGNIPVQLKKGDIFRVQDWMIAEIVTSNNWEKPVYFAVTVSNSNKLKLNDYMIMEGLTFRLFPEKTKTKLNEVKTRHNLWNVYKYNGITDTTLFKNPTTKKLVSNYNAAYFQLALKYHNELGKSEEGIQTLERADSLIGVGWRGYYLMSQIYTKMKKFDDAILRLEQVLDERPQEISALINVGGLYQRVGKVDEAISTYERVLEIRPNLAQGFQALEKLYNSKKDYQNSIKLINKWLQLKPDDKNALKRRAIYAQRLKSLAPVKNTKDSTSDGINDSSG